MTGTTVYILMGSNLGDRERNLTTAFDKLSGLAGLEIIAASSIYISEAQGMKPDTPAFLNQVVKAEYLYPAAELLASLERLERSMGRTDKGLKQPRTIDLDILLFGDSNIATDTLTVPHKELLNRPFAMVPLLQIDPDLVHPVTKSPIASFMTDQQRQQVLLYRDHVARII